MHFPIELVNIIFNYLNINIQTYDDIKCLDNCSICNKLFVNTNKKWSCSHQCESQLLLML